MVWESSHGELVDAGVDGLLSFFFFFFFCLLRETFAGIRLAFL